MLLLSASRVTHPNYLEVLAAGVVLERFANYVWFEQPVIWGQPPNVLTTFLFFALAGGMWILTPWPSTRSRWLVIFLVAMAMAWVTHLLLYRYHGDGMNYTAALYVPILLMILLKPLNVSGVRDAVLTFAWTTSVLLVLTRVLEMFGVLSIRSQARGIISFDEERYFLPLNDLLDIEGRWPGPFGHNGDTAMMGALLILIAIAFWSRASWFFLTIGALTLAITNGRASIGAVAAGIVVITMFSRSAWVDFIPRLLRLIGGSLVLIAAALFMFARPAGLTGRDAIWPAFLDLWASSPWIGVGGFGIHNGGEITSWFLHAHSLYIDELARYGLVGFVSQFGALTIGVGIAAVAGWRGAPGPLGVLVAYLVTGVTEPRNNWIAPSATGFLVILMVVAAAAMLKKSPKKSENLSEQPPGTSDRYRQNHQKTDGSAH